MYSLDVLDSATVHAVVKSKMSAHIRNRTHDIYLVQPLDYIVLPTQSNVTVPLSFRLTEESLIDVTRQIWFYITTLYVQVEHTFRTFNFNCTFFIYARAAFYDDTHSGIICAV
jgi:hypothetical protein